MDRVGLPKDLEYLRPSYNPSSGRNVQEKDLQTHSCLQRTLDREFACRIIGIPFNWFCRSCKDLGSKEAVEHFLFAFSALARTRLKSLHVTNIPYFFLAPFVIYQDILRFFMRLFQIFRNFAGFPWEFAAFADISGLTRNLYRCFLRKVSGFSELPVSFSRNF